MNRQKYVVVVALLAFIIVLQGVAATPGDVLFLDTGNGTIDDRWQGTGTIIYSTDGLSTINVTAVAVDKRNMTPNAAASGAWFLKFQFYDPGDAIGAGKYWSFGFYDYAGGDHTYSTIGSGICNQQQTNYAGYSDDCGAALTARSTAWHNASILMNFSASKSVLSIDGINYANDSGLPAGAWDSLRLYTNFPSSLNWKFDNITLCDTYCPEDAPPGVVDTPSWVVPTPSDAASNNTQVTLNASSASPGVRYFIWFDTNPSPSTLVVNNATSGNYSTSVPGTTTTYYYKAGAWNATDGYSSNTSVRSWTFDAVSPAIVLNPTNEFNEQNYSRRDPFDTVLHLNITFTDDHDLYGMSVNVTRDGVVYFNESNESLNGLSYSYVRSVSEASWPVGRYNVSIFVSDSHTAREIPSYQVSAKKSSVTFKPGNDNNIKIESRELSTITTTKSIDRYSFRVVFDDASTRARSFDVKTDKCPLVYKPRSGYKAHFVSSCGVGGNWIDFEGASGTPTVTRMDDFHYVVSFDSLERDITFHSIGGLNLLNVNYTFYKGDYATINPSPVSKGESGFFFLNVTTESGIANISAVLNYNGSAHVPDVSSTAELFNFSRTLNAPMAAVNLSYDWTVTVTQGDGNVTVFVASAIQTVTDWAIVSCGTPAFVNWTQYDEDNPTTKLTGTFAVEVEYWVGNRSNAQFYNESFPSANSWTLCFSPSPNNFTANIYAQNTVPESFTHRFYVQNTTFSNVTTFYNVYNANDTNDALYSDMKITTRYVASYGYFNNVFAQLQRRYVGEGVWRTVQYDKSGDFGLLFFDVREQSVDYRLRYYDENNSLLLETDSLKFVCTSTVCELTQLLNPASASTPNPDVVSSVSFNNVTSILTVTWDSGTATDSTVDIMVTKRNYGGLVTVCSTTQTGVGGSFDCNATGYTGELFVSVDVDGEQNSGEYVTIGRVSLGSLMSKASQVLVTFLFMVAIMAFGLFSPIALVITTIIALVVVFFMGTLTAITATFIVIAAVVGFVIAIKVKQ